MGRPPSMWIVCIALVGRLLPGRDLLGLRSGCSSSRDRLCWQDSCATHTSSSTTLAIQQGQASYSACMHLILAETHADSAFLLPRSHRFQLEIFALYVLYVYFFFCGFCIVTSQLNFSFSRFRFLILFLFKITIFRAFIIGPCLVLS